MKQLYKIASITGLLLGSFALSAFATDWQAPTKQPPQCPSGSPGCDAPINVSNKWQVKKGPLGVGNGVTLTSGYNFNVTGGGIFDYLTTNQLTVSGSNPGKGKILIDDGSGIGHAIWQDASAVGGVTSITASDRSLNIGGSRIEGSTYKGAVTINVDSSYKSAGSVGGGCYGVAPANGIGSDSVKCWGSASSSGGEAQMTCTDPGYTKHAILRNNVNASLWAYLCVKD